MICVKLKRKFQYEYQEMYCLNFIWKSNYLYRYLLGKTLYQPNLQTNIQINNYWIGESKDNLKMNKIYNYHIA